ncbi:zinc finger MYM-type protein 1-like [Macrobrachium rosenbergii]|uniref:zinc finger MYM-type protein 1-like n=1 Tax=Macrobrachium rosenbergii TaxID=79674 RepID=UPI0034D43881
MDEFITIQKRSATEKSESEESSTKTSKGDSDVETTAKVTMHSALPSQIQKMKEDIAQADISISANSKPVQPRLKEYPKHSEGNTTARSFVGAWFDKYDWAECSQERDALFCFACRHFASPSYGNADDAFVKIGFRRWKKAQGKYGAIAKHLSAYIHKSSYTAWIDYQHNKTDKTSIKQSISEGYQKKVRENRHYIKTLAERVKSGPKNEKYTTSAIQNEMIDTFASIVREEIAENIKSCHYFSVQADEAKDVSKIEQLALVVRFYDEISHCIQECLISFTPMSSLDAAYITDIILKALEKLGLEYKSSLVGLGFDGASVMSEGISGVQKCIKEKTPFAYYVHCYGHKLNLVLTSVAKNVPQASEFSSLLEELYIFASNAVAHEKSLSIQREMFPEEQIRELQHLSDTRWWCRATSCENALLCLKCIIRFLKETSADDTGARAVSTRG